MRLRENYPTIQTIQNGYRKTLKSLDIEALLHWTYQRQKADVIVDRGQGLHGIEALLAAKRGEIGEVISHSFDGCVKLAEIVAMGAHIQAWDTSGGDLHPDAETIHEAIRIRRKGALTSLQRGLVLMHARAGTQPDWMRGAAERWEPVRRPDGSVKIVWHTTGTKMPSHCEIRLAVSQEEIDLARWVYSQWWAGMAWLRWYLTQHKLLKDHGATGPACHNAPWQAASDSRAAA